MSVIKIINNTAFQNSTPAKPDLKPQTSGNEEALDTTRFNQLNTLIKAINHSSESAAAINNVERIKQLIYENKYPINLDKVVDQLLAEDLLTTEAL